jgi:two-component system NtrC family sensor kinase
MNAVANLEDAHVGDKPVVLVIDDSDIDRQAISDLLSRAGFDVHGLPTPIGATRIARQLHVKVVIIDQNLPAMDGSKLAALFRKNPSMHAIRVVLVSGGDEKAMTALAREAQVDAFVSKRQLHDELISTVRKLVP